MPVPLRMIHAVGMVCASPGNPERPAEDIPPALLGNEQTQPLRMAEFFCASRQRWTIGARTDVADFLGRPRLPIGQRASVIGLDDFFRSSQELPLELERGIHQAGDQRGPTCLVTGSTAAAGVAMEVLVEQDQILIIQGVTVERLVFVTGPHAVTIDFEQAYQTSADFEGDHVADAARAAAVDPQQSWS